MFQGVRAGVLTPPSMGRAMGPTTTPETLPVPGGKLAFERAGRGPPIVWIHAAIADRRMWDREFATFARGNEVVRYDVRGLGASPPATEPYSDSEDLLALLDHLRLPPAVLVGCSNGGRIAIDLALTHPRRVRGLVLVAAGVGGMQIESEEEREGFERAGALLAPPVTAFRAGEKEKAREGVLAYWCAAQSGASLDHVRRMMDDNLEEIFTERSASHSRPVDPPAARRLAEIHVPTLILTGDKDAAETRLITARLTRGIPHARHQVVPGADHLVNLSRPAEFEHAVRGFLDQLPAPAG